MANKKTFGARTNLPTSGTEFGSKIRADLNHINPPLHGFVANEVMQLVETPSIKPEIHPLAEPFLSYSFQVFNNNCSGRTIADNLFADCMVPVSLETSFPAGNLLEKLSGRVSAFALEPCSQTLEFEPVRFNLLTAKELPAACYSNMVYSDINTQKSVRTSLDVNASGKCDMQKHSLLVPDKQGSLVIPVKVFPVVFRNIQIKSDWLLQSSQSDFISMPSGVPLVKGKRHKLLEFRMHALRLLDRFNRLRSNSYCIYCKLGRQVKVMSCLIINQMMKPVSVTYSIAKCFVGYVLDSFGILFYSFKKQRVAGNSYLDGCDGFHINSKDGILYKAYAGMSSGYGGFAFLPRLKAWVFSEYTL